MLKKLLSWLVQRGVVLGVGFDSRDMTWFLPEKKANKVIERCLTAEGAKFMDLNQVQKLMGSINDLAQMCPVLKHHKRAGNSFMTTFGGDFNILKPVP